MSYLGFGTLIYFTIFIVNTLLPFAVQAESENPILDLSTQEIILDTTNIDVVDELNEELYSEDEIYSEEEICPENESVSSESDESFFSFLDESQEYISSSVESMARNMDEFFTTNRDFYETSGSYLSLKQNVLFRERGLIEHTSKVKFRLRLPNTEKNLKLFFESPEDKNPYDISTQTENIPTTADDANYILGIQADSGEDFGWKYKPSIGLSLDSTIDPFIKLRFSKEFNFSKWNIKWHETPYWYNSSGWDFDSYLELNRKISKDNLFRASTFARWKDEIEQFELNQVFSMFHTISKEKALSYYAGVYGVSEPKVHTTHFLLGLNYRQNIHKDYLFIEIKPQILYQKINRFHAEHSIQFSLEMIFKK